MEDLPAKCAGRRSKQAHFFAGEPGKGQFFRKIARLLRCRMIWKMIAHGFHLVQITLEIEFVSKKRKKVFALPDGWEEKLANAPKVAVSGPTKTYIKTLREALADDKTKKPLSLTKLGEEFLGVDRKTISRWEKGDGNPQGRSQQEETLADWAWQIYVIQTFPPEQWEEQASMHKPWLGKGKRNPYANEN